MQPCATGGCAHWMHSIASWCRARTSSATPTRSPTCRHGDGSIVHRAFFRAETVTPKKDHAEAVQAVFEAFHRYGGTQAMKAAEARVEELRAATAFETRLQEMTPVTWARYLPFVQATGHAQPPHVRCVDGIWQAQHFAQWQQLDLQAPAVHLNAFDAQAWCEWAGRRLPTEAWAASAGASNVEDDRRSCSSLNDWQPASSARCSSVIGRCARYSDRVSGCT